MRRRALAATAGLLADMALGEPPVSPHPVGAFGSLMNQVEGHLYRDSRPAGLGHAALGATVGLAAGRLVPSTVVATYLAVAQRALAEAASAVGDALARGDLEEARSRLPSLVGRDPSGLDEKEVSRAAVESVAENSVDAVVAPVLWAAVGAAPGALAYRAINTMDAMVGHRSERYLHYGWASARLDDVANLVPARVTAALVALVRPRSAVAVFRAVVRDAPAHPSPNAGVAEAAFAAALGLRLGGTNRYTSGEEVRPQLGTGRPAEPADIARAVSLLRDVSWALAGGLTALGVTS